MMISDEAHEYPALSNLYSASCDLNSIKIIFWLITCFVHILTKIYFRKDENKDLTIIVALHRA